MDYPGIIHGSSMHYPWISKDIHGYPWNLWRQFGVTLELLWDQFDATLVSLWGHCEFLWGHSGVSFLSFGITLGSVLGHFGISLGSIPSQFGVNPGIQEPSAR